MRSLLIFGRLDLLSLSYCTAEYLFFFHATHTSPIGIYRYIYLLDNEISTFYTVRHPYHPDAPNIYTQPVSLSEAPLTLGIADDLCFQAEAFFFKCPLSRSSVKQLLGSHVPLLLDMSMIAMVFIICNRPTAILLWDRKVVAGCRYLHCTVTNSGWCFGIKSVPYLEGV